MFKKKQHKNRLDCIITIAGDFLNEMLPLLMLLMDSDDKMVGTTNHSQGAAQK